MTAFSSRLLLGGITLELLSWSCLWSSGATEGALTRTTSLDSDLPCCCGDARMRWCGWWGDGLESSGVVICVVMMMVASATGS